MQAITLSRKVQLVCKVEDRLTQINDGAGVEWVHYQGCTEQDVIDDLWEGNFTAEGFYSFEKKFIIVLIKFWIQEQEWEKKANA